jgi:hypothetical protein
MRRDTISAGAMALLIFCGHADCFVALDFGACPGRRCEAK